MDSPVLAFVLAVLAVPGVTSLLTSGIRFVSDRTGISPKVIVYVASLIVTGAILSRSGAALPAWADDGPGFIAAWLAWANVNAELARRVYEVLMERVAPGTQPA